MLGMAYECWQKCSLSWPILKAKQQLLVLKSLVWSGYFLFLAQTESETG